MRVPAAALPAQQLRRLRQITTVLVKYGFPDVVARLKLDRTVALGRRLLPWRRRVAPPATRAVRLRLALEELGPTFIKLGQAFSVRSDLLSADLVEELSRLQDMAPSLSPGAAEEAVEHELGLPLDRVFVSFDRTPLAAASIAQVHRARLLDGQEVAVKVRRPGIEVVIERDLGVLALLARLAERYLPDAELYQPALLVAEFARVIRRELDCAREGRTIERFARNFHGDPTVRFPHVHWAATANGVLTMEYIDGTKAMDALTGPAPFDPVVVSARAGTLLLKQVLRDGLFHADPHPANVFVLPGDVICLLDFGSVGRFDRRLRDTLARMVDAIVREDAERLSAAILSIGRPLHALDEGQLRRDLADLIDGYAGSALRDLSLANLLQDWLAVMRRHRLQFPVELMLLARAFVTVDGVCRRLDPSFNMVEHARPVIAEILRERMTPSALASRAVETGREVVDALQTLPRDLVEIVAKARGDRFQIQFVHRNLEHLVQVMDRASNRLAFAVVIAALVVGSSLVLRGGARPYLFGLPAVGLIGFVAAALLGLWLAVGILRSGRL